MDHPFYQDPLSYAPGPGSNQPVLYEQIQPSPGLHASEPPVLLNSPPVEYVQGKYEQRF